MLRYFTLLFIFFIPLLVVAQISPINNLNANDFNTALHKQTNNTLLDVRTLGEFSSSHLPNSDQLNYYAFNFKESLLLLAKDQAIFLYCTTGYRSLKAANFLAKQGYTQVYNLENGIMEWELLNLLTISDPNATNNAKDKITIETYQSIIGSQQLVLVDFYAPWCGPCKKLMPIVDSLGKAHINDLEILKINVDASKKLSRKLQLIGVPHLQVIKNGQVISEHKGFMNAHDLNQLISKHL